MNPKVPYQHYNASEKDIENFSKIFRFNASEIENPIKEEEWWKYQWKLERRENENIFRYNGEYIVQNGEKIPEWQGFHVLKIPGKLMRYSDGIFENGMHIQWKRRFDYEDGTFAEINGEFYPNGSPKNATKTTNHDIDKSKILLQKITYTNGHLLKKITHFTDGRIGVSNWETAIIFKDSNKNTIIEKWIRGQDGNWNQVNLRLEDEANQLNNRFLHYLKVKISTLEDDIMKTIKFQDHHPNFHAGTFQKIKNKLANIQLMVHRSMKTENFSLQKHDISLLISEIQNLSKIITPISYDAEALMELNNTLIRTTKNYEEIMFRI